MVNDTAIIQGNIVHGIVKSMNNKKRQSKILTLLEL